MPTLNYDPDHLFFCPVCGQATFTLLICKSGYACPACVQSGMAELLEAYTCPMTVTFTVDTREDSCYTLSDRGCNDESTQEGPTDITFTQERSSA